MSVLCVVQARVSSSRLPRKILADVGGVPMLAKIAARVQRARSVSSVVVATTTDASDDAVVALGASIDVAVVRGAELDVLSRYTAAAAAFPDADHIVRVTADCPFIDPGVIDDVVHLCLDEDLGYGTNQPANRRLQTFPHGLAVECFTRDVLVRTSLEASRRFEREHVTPAMYADPAVRVGHIAAERDYTAHRWTVDTPEDLAVVRALHASLGRPEPYGWRDILEVAERNPDLELANTGVHQKSVHEVDERWSQE